MVRLRLWNVHRFVGRRNLVGVIPHQNGLIDLTYWPTGDHLLPLGDPWRQIFGIRHMRTLALTVVAPAMKWALNGLTDDTRASTRLITDSVAKVCTHMWAICIQYFYGTALGAKDDQLLIKITQGFGLTDGQIM